jgi:hypothetical protein
MPTPGPEVRVLFDMGEIKADPARNRVYLIDQSGLRVLALDTDLGQVVAVAALAGSPHVSVVNGGLNSGQMAVSLDGSKLYVALTAANKIQVFSLPNLTPLTTLPVSFSPESLSTGVNNRLYASSTDYWGILREVDTTNGSVVQEIDGNGLDLYMHTLLRTNAAGTRLYFMQTYLWVDGGPGYVYEYDITGVRAAFVDSHPFAMVSTSEFGVDELYKRLYTINGGIYGVEVSDLTIKAYGVTWPFGSAYAVGLAFLQNGDAIYGASGDPYSGNIRKFRRSDGAVLADYVVGTYGKPMVARGLAITPNGNLIYVKKAYAGTILFDGWECYLGIIGRSSVTLNTAFGGARSNVTLTDVRVSNSTPHDGGHHPGDIVSVAPAFTNFGAELAPTVSVDVAVGPGGELLSPGLQSLGSIPSGTSATFGTFNVRLEQNLPPRSTITLTFTSHWENGKSLTFPYTLVVE